MIERLKYIYLWIVDSFNIVMTIIYSLQCRMPINLTWRFIGKPIIIKPSIFLFKKNNTLEIGNKVKLISSVSMNSLGLIQPVIINASHKNCKILIGDNVGISGSTISALKSITIGNDVLIGTGCIITDNDAHNIDPMLRHVALNSDHIKSVIIEDNVFIGARTIILKGVTIGKNSVIGAGSVVTKSIPPNVVAAGNPAVVIRNL